MSAWYLQSPKTYNADIQLQAEEYQATLTKPIGSLGRLEQIAAQFSAWQGTLKPVLDHIDIAIFAGDHGVAAEGVSAFPQAVTAEMVKNFASGGAAISVLSRQMGAHLTVVNVGTISVLDPVVGVIDNRIAAGTANICNEPAMTVSQMEQAMLAGKQVVEDALSRSAQLFIGGEMGIANTTSAACIMARLLDLPADQVAGPGTGLSSPQILHKVSVIDRALSRHPAIHPLEVLQTLGGFEIAALAGAYIASAQNGVPVLIDGYITSAAALVAVGINPAIKPWLMASHRSAEPAHVFALQALGLEPLLDIGMRLGEASGAAIVVPILKSACDLQREMASFSTAGVSGKI